MPFFDAVFQTVQECFSLLNKIGKDTEDYPRICFYVKDLYLDTILSAKSIDAVLITKSHN